MIKNKRVGIIGAGISGLLAIKYALEYGLQPEAFQKSASLGGVWNSKTGSVWHEMKTNISKYTMSFMGFPWPEQSPVFPPSGQVQKYLQSYAHKYNLLGHIHFNSQVLSIEKHKEKENIYVVIIKNGETQIYKQYEYLIIASGIFSKSYLPDIDGLDKFKGAVKHSKFYKNGQDYAGKKVLVLGGSLTGVEVASNVSKYAEQVYHSFKQPFWVIPHYCGPENQKLPIDFYRTRKTYLTQTAVYDENLTSSKTTCKEQQEIPQIRVDEKYFHKSIYVSISSDYVNQCKDKKITPIKSTIKEIKENSIVLQSVDDKKQILCQVDEILLCTGYKAGLDYLSKEILEIIEYQENDRLQPIILYLQMYHPKLQNLFFVGMYKNPNFAVMELQTQFAIRKICGLVELPSAEQIEKGITQERQIRDKPHRQQFPHPDAISFADKISKVAGNKFEIQHFLNDPTSASAAEFFKLPVFPCIQNSFTSNNLPQQLKDSLKIIDSIPQKRSSQETLTQNPLIE